MRAGSLSSLITLIEATPSRHISSRDRQSSIVSVPLVYMMRTVSMGDSLVRYRILGIDKGVKSNRQSLVTNRVIRLYDVGRA